MQFEKIINTVYSFGAAVVIFGAWGKLEHKDFGSAALTVGLLTEVAIFCVYGLMEWRKKSRPEARDNGDSLWEGEEERLLAKKGVFGKEGIMGNEDLVRWEREGEKGLTVNAVAAGAEVKELTDTMKQTNQILNKVFRTE